MANLEHQYSWVRVCKEVLFPISDGDILEEIFVSKKTNVVSRLLVKLKSGRLKVGALTGQSQVFFVFFVIVMVEW